MSLEELSSPGFDDDFQTNDTGDHVHIRIQQRNGRKCLTTVQGIPEKADLKKILKVFKKEFCCNGNLADVGEEGEESSGGSVLQLQGDQRNNVKTFLLKAKIVREDQITIHGY
eukprot:c3931_g1_i1.p1 GENE.c3931_g1_i1~~c3931_g1_i1.p1  ORF type:complete len:122 (+),score=39.38 c3931_g1_i1:29-367(+)